MPFIITARSARAFFVVQQNTNPDIIIMVVFIHSLFLAGKCHVPFPPHFYELREYTLPMNFHYFHFETLDGLTRCIYLLHKQTDLKWNFGPFFRGGGGVQSKVICIASNRSTRI